MALFIKKILEQRTFWLSSQYDLKVRVMFRYSAGAVLSIADGGLVISCVGKSWVVSGAWNCWIMWLAERSIPDWTSAMPLMSMCMDSNADTPILSKASCPISASVLTEICFISNNSLNCFPKFARKVVVGGAASPPPPQLWVRHVGSYRLAVETVYTDNPLLQLGWCENSHLGFTRHMWLI